MVKALAKLGVRDWCLSPGIRNTVLIDCVMTSSEIEKHLFFDDRAASFFALGRARLKKRPVAVCVTSGTAVGELLPAAMEAYYTETPLIFVTADRPKRYRFTGAPQTANQENIFGVYAPHFEDIEFGIPIEIFNWSMQKPAHLNICLEESYHHDYSHYPEVDLFLSKEVPYQPLQAKDPGILIDLFDKAKNPLAIVGTLLEEEVSIVQETLIKWGLPVILESNSCLRNDPSLDHLSIKPYNNILKMCEDAGYPIDAIIRIGGIPTVRLWRDLEGLEDSIQVVSISRLPFTGLPNGKLIHGDLNLFFRNFDKQIPKPRHGNFEKLLSNARNKEQFILRSFEKYPNSEPALVYKLSLLISKEASVYLGNSMPIREWDLFASNNAPYKRVRSSKGLNGIDGQISTFLGLALDEPGEHWGVVGDLTALYDLSAPWIANKTSTCKLVIINNGGGQIFARKKLNQYIINPHPFSFKAWADLYYLPYERWEDIPEESVPAFGLSIIEMVPELSQTNAFWEGLESYD